MLTHTQRVLIVLEMKFVEPFLNGANAEEERVAQTFFDQRDGGGVETIEVSM